MFLMRVELDKSNWSDAANHLKDAFWLMPEFQGLIVHYRVDKVKHAQLLADLKLGMNLSLKTANGKDVTLAMCAHGNKTKG